MNFFVGRLESFLQLRSLEISVEGRDLKVLYSFVYLSFMFSWISLTPLLVSQPRLPVKKMNGEPSERRRYSQYYCDAFDYFLRGAF